MVLYLHLAQLDFGETFKAYLGILKTLNHFLVMLNANVTVLLCRILCIWRNSLRIELYGIITVLLNKRT